MKAILITIGDEILIGRTIDTNSAWMAAELNLLGFSVAEIISISDERNHILETLNRVSIQANVVLITGGLGPTSDDITKQTLADHFESGLSFRPEIYESMAIRYEGRGRELLEKHKEQAVLPDKCDPLINSMGTAPGMWFDKDGVVYVSMPGVPYEMKHIMKAHVLPRLRKRFEAPVILHKHILTAGIPEALLSERLADFEKQLPRHIKLAYLPDLAQVKLRLSGRGTDAVKLAQDIDKQQKLLFELVPKYIFGEDDDTLQGVIGNKLREKNMTLSTAESCTGGKIASRITSVAGCSDYYLGSVVSYSNEVKMQQLGVKEETLRLYGAVSEETVREMLSGVRALLKTDYSIAVSGIAGPGGAVEGKPVGTIFIGVEGPEETHVRRFSFPGNRGANINISVVVALHMLNNFLDGQFAIQP